MRGANKWKSGLGWWWRRTIFQEAAAGPLCAGGNDSEMCVPIDEMHPPDLMQLVLVGVLDDAQAVDSEVPKPEGVGDVDHVENSLGKERASDDVAVSRDVGCGGLVGLCSAPHVAEREICAVFAVHRD